MTKIARKLTDLVGNTPLMELSGYSGKYGLEQNIIAKLEAFNPAGSVKDRVALSMIEDAEARGALKPGATIIEPTSGNTGVGLAMVATIKGYHLILTMPETMSLERRNLLKALGAQIVLTDGLGGMAASIAKAQELRDSIPGSVILQQFENPANAAVHERTTGEEIWRDTDGEVAVFVAGVGTGGTVCGVARALKKHNPDIYIVAVEEKEETDRGLLNLEDIREFADTVELSDVKELLDAQIRSNMAIAHEGMTGKYGLGIGRVIRENYSHDMLTRMRSLTAAASEARMGGCDMPVVINSGSGNQGIACSVPLIVYAREMELPDYSLYRALVFSNLLTVYQKQYIGKLSAFCGAVSASCAAGAAITYMVGGDISLIKKTIENTLANIPGIICDGAKISCAAKIAACLDAAFLAHHLAMNGQSYAPYTGILQEETAETISCVGQIGKDGMKETDREILKIMLEH